MDLRQKMTDTRLYLAPLAGITDSTYRRLCFENGADAAVTEMVSAKALHFMNENTCDLLRTTPEESVWIAPRRDGKGLYAALFNLSDRKRTVRLAAAEMNGAYRTSRDLWTGGKCSASRGLRASLAPHDAAVFIVTA